MREREKERKNEIMRKMGGEREIERKRHKEKEKGIDRERD